jgi:hypothetical protein
MNVFGLNFLEKMESEQKVDVSNWAWKPENSEAQRSMVQVCQLNHVNLLMLLKKIAEKIQIAPMKVWQLNNRTSEGNIKNELQNERI